ncbi:MAG: LytTR family DNA-binding domain-containing protein [Lachnospiraceae bacterium]|nr:LytTR family DNA-binding domain-containing protein [Lachnospiraceae bacterium]
MYVAIVDDEKMQRDIMSTYLTRLGEKFKVQIQMDEFVSGDMFLKQYKSGYDVIMFDVDMPGINGIDTARKIREIDQNVIIMYVTNIAQYAIMGYEVEAIDYILKPIGYDEFSMKFQKVIRKVQQKADQYMLFEFREGLKRLKISDFYYIEVQNHNLHYHCQSGEYHMRGSMNTQENELRGYHFSRIHKSYLVNLAHVKKMTSDTVEIDDEKIPVGRAYKERLMQDYMNYLRG